MEQNYAREEVYNPETIEKLSEHYRAILELLGEDTDREGLVKTPERIAKAMCFLTRGYDEDPREILLSAKFHEEYKQMVIVKDIELYSHTFRTAILPDSLKSPGLWKLMRAVSKCRND